MLAAFETDAEEFRTRRTMARRSGSPAWLWPEVPQSSWAEAATEISRVAASVLGGERPFVSPCDTKALSLACYTTGVGPLLGWWVQAEILRTDAETGALLDIHLEQSRLRHARVSALSREIVRSLRTAGLDTLVLKGGHTAHAYFPDPATRPSSDLDLLVRSDEAGDAQAVLDSAGFKCVGCQARESSWAPAGQAPDPGSLWLVHADDPWSVDLHSSLDFSASSGGPLVRLDGARPFDECEPWPLDPTAGVLREPLFLLHLAVHASGGFHSLTLLRMIELVLVIRKDSAAGVLSWDEFLRIAEQTNALGAAYPALRLCEKLMPGTVPGRVLDRCALAAPPRVRRIVERLEPATAQRIDRTSISEHFMWVTGVSGWMRQLGSDLVPGSSLWPVYQARAYRLLRGRISR